jgi:DNA-binding transcriptional LysR family regulator
VWELQDATAVAAFVAAGLGVGLAPAFTTAARSDVEAVRLKSNIAPRTLAIVWHRERDPSPTVTQFVGIANAVSKLLQTQYVAPQRVRLPESA